LWTALEDPDPVLIFEHGTLYNMEGELATDAGAVDIDKAAVRRSGTDVSLLTYGGTLAKALQAAEELARAAINAEVVDLRTLRPLDSETILESVTRTHRAVIIDEGSRSGSISAEISARIMEGAFYELDVPVARHHMQCRSAGAVRETPGRGCRSTGIDNRRNRDGHGGRPWLNFACRRSVPTWKPAPSSNGSSSRATR
jgi:pyruvate dehydrogenase E1 component beta subunit